MLTGALLYRRWPSNPPVLSSINGPQNTPVLDGLFDLFMRPSEAVAQQQKKSNGKIESARKDVGKSY